MVKLVAQSGRNIVSGFCFHKLHRINCAFNRVCKKAKNKRVFGFTMFLFTWASVVWAMFAFMFNPHLQFNWFSVSLSLAFSPPPSQRQSFVESGVLRPRCLANKLRQVCVRRPFCLLLLLLNMRQVAKFNNETHKLPKVSTSPRATSPLDSTGSFYPLAASR